MDDQEAEYLRQHIHDLERSRSWWRAAALVSWTAPLLFLVAGGLTTVTLGLFGTQRMRQAEMRALEAEMEAREQADRARHEAMAAQEQAERARQAEREVRQKVETLTTKKSSQKPGGAKQP